uniref:Uncharacterized protein n=1 Tax=Amphimedon queenslandica TaxID=400682 RepID=A0A1X7U217_AMPQE
MKPKLLSHSLLISLTLFIFLPHYAKAQSCLPGTVGGTIGGVIGGIIIGSIVSIIITVRVMKSLGYGGNVDVQLNPKRDHSLSLSDDVLSDKDSCIPVKYTRKVEKSLESSAMVDSTSLLIQNSTDKRGLGKPAAYLTPGEAPNLPSCGPPSIHPLSPPPFSPPDKTYVGDDEYDIPCIRPSNKITNSSKAGLHKVPSSSKPLTKSLSVDEMKALRLIKEDTMDLEEQYEYFDGPKVGSPSDDEYYVHVVQDKEEQNGLGKGGPAPKLATPMIPTLPVMRPPIDSGVNSPSPFSQVKLKPVIPKDLSASTLASQPSNIIKKLPPAPKPKPAGAKKLSKELSNTLPSKPRQLTRSSSFHEYMNVGFKLPKGKQ